MKHCSRRSTISGLCVSGLGFTSLIAVAVGHAAGMVELTNDELSGVVGQEGVAVEFELRANADAQGQPLNPLCATDLAQTDCRLALQFTGRESEWVVLKGFYGSINIPALHLDSGRTPPAATEFEDLDRFRDGDGTPLLATPHDIPALEVSFPQDIEIWNLTISGVSVEYDTGSGSGFVPGYMRNELGSFLGLKISNSVEGQPARITAEGRATIYGF